MSRRAFAAFGGGAALTLAKLFAGATAGCTGEVDTGGRRVLLATRVEADMLRFENTYGFAVELERALISLGPLRYLEGAPVAGLKPQSPRRFLLERLFDVEQAWAHPGHYVEGGTLGEMLEPVTVDLTRGVTELGSWPGVTGLALSARFCFESPPSGALAAELGSDVAFVEGKASKAGTTYTFRAAARVEAILDADGHPFVAGCVLESGDITEDGAVTLAVKPSVWLDQVDFGELEASDERIALEPSGTPHKAFVRGLKKAAAYAFRYEPGLVLE